MNSEDMFNVLFMKSPLLRMHYMETMRTAMVAEDMKRLDSFLNEQEWWSVNTPLNERILGQEVTTGKNRETSTPESITGIGLLQSVLEVVEKSGFKHAAFLTITLNDSASAIQGITLSFQSSAVPISPATSAEQTHDMLTRFSQNTATLRDSLL